MKRTKFAKLAKVQEQKPWHSLKEEDVLKLLHSSLHGLSIREARHRKSVFGSNKIKLEKKRSNLVRFLNQFNNVLIYILFGAAVITLSLSHVMDTIVIVAATLINAVIGFIQEGKAEKALNAIRQMLSPKATVRRGGKRHVIAARSLVPGDIVLLQSGDKVPADLRLIQTKTLQIQESVLTGESMSVTKSADILPEITVLADRRSMAYSGTTVTYGRGEGVVVATGKYTEIGKITQYVSEIRETKTPLITQFNRFSGRLSLAIIFISFITFLVGVFLWGDASREMFMAVVGLAVAAIPEGLPAIVTITLAIGVTRMAARNAIIRKLPAVETMGSVTVVCTDKTGTLTHNELSVRHIITAENSYRVSGEGYSDIGEISINGSGKKECSINEDRVMRELVRAITLCNDAELVREDHHFHLHGNPVDGAFLVLGMKAHVEREEELLQLPRTDFIPFESEHKWMASLHHDHAGHGYIFVKGAPEVILSHCVFARTRDKDIPLDHEYWTKAVHNLAEEGNRVVAIAMRKTKAEHRNLLFRDIDHQLILLGVAGLIDLPREEAKSAIARCQSAGIQVKMITGDHALTAKAVAKEVGILNSDQVIVGKDLDQMTDEALARRAEEVNIYARTSPTHKLRLVRALQKRGNIVAMTGDGINDAPALKQAEIGIAMGGRGTEATKEVSEMVITDDNFASICHAIEEGRTVYDNLKKSILYTLPTNGGEAFIIVLAIFLGLALPITAIQILWVNMITEVTFALALAFESAEVNVMHHPPRRKNEPLFSPLLVWRMVFVTALMVACGFGMYVYEMRASGDIAIARTVVVNMLVIAQGVYLFNCRKIQTTLWGWKSWFNNKVALLATLIVIIFQLGFTYLPGLEKFFGVKPIGVTAWIYIVVLSLGLFVVIEIEKLIGRKFFSGRKRRLI